MGVIWAWQVINGSKLRGGKRIYRFAHDDSLLLKLHPQTIG